METVVGYWFGWPTDRRTIERARDLAGVAQDEVLDLIDKAPTVALHIAIAGTLEAKQQEWSAAGYDRETINLALEYACRTTDLAARAVARAAAKQCRPGSKPRASS
jgi:hypothetical protein